jgi:hypothetical protein
LVFFGIISAIRLKVPNWAWAEFEGIVTLLLGMMLWAARPWLAPQFLGLADLARLVLPHICAGITQLAMGQRYPASSLTKTIKQQLETTFVSRDICRGVHLKQIYFQNNDHGGK